MIHYVVDKLHVRLGLVEAAHYPKTNTQVVLFHERRNDRVEWPLAGRHGVRVRRVHLKESGAVVQVKTIAFHRHTGSKA